MIEYCGAMFVRLVAQAGFWAVVSHISYHTVVLGLSCVFCGDTVQFYPQCFIHTVSTNNK